MVASLPVLILAVIASGAIVGVVLLGRRLADLSRDRERLVARFRGVVDADAECTRVLRELEAERASANADLQAFIRETNGQRARMETELAATDAEVTTLTNRRDVLQAEVSLLDEQAMLHSFGVYQPHYAFSTSQEHAERLVGVRDRQKGMVKSRTAAFGAVEWLVNGSKREGQKQINQTLKLQLRAFNGECDAAIANVRYNNLHVMEARIEKAYEVLNSLTSVQQCQISSGFLALKLDGLHLAFEYEKKKQEEKEEQKCIRE